MLTLTRFALAALLTALAVLPCAGQPAVEVAAEPAAPPAAEEDLGALLQQMGAPPEIQMLMQLMDQGDGIDPMMMMMLMRMAGEGGMDDDILGIMFMQKMMSGAGKPKPAATTVVDGKLLIADDGVLYKLDLETMEIEGSVAYRQKKKTGMADMLQMMMPMITQAQEKAEQASCMSNLKQIGLGMLMYCQDWDEVFPGETWVEDVFPYIKNEQIFRCPAEPDLPRGYAYNAALAGMAMGDIPRPAETVLIFDTDIADDNPLGGLEDTAARHNGGVNVGFADGHVKWISPERLEDLIWDPLEQQ